MIRQAARRESIERHVRLGLIGGAAVFATWLAIMFLLGVLLAVSTSRVPVYHEHHQTVGSGEIWRERFYLIVLSLSVLIFYVSVPFVALGLLAITLVLFGILLALRVIHLGILSRGFFATWGVIRSAFVGSSEEVLGIIATQRQHPQLFAALQEVADRLATSPVDTVYLTPSSLTGVREEGKGPFGVFRRRRVMELGVSTMSVLTTSEFKSILAHEYAHFTNRDSVYIRFISQATASLGNSLAVMNAAGGFINYVNPFFWAYWLYLRAYILLAAGFSRSREFLADRRAVLEYGTEPFASALTRTAVDGTLFEWSAVPNVMNELNAGRAFVNVFDTFRQFREQAEHAGAQGKVLDDIRAAKSNWCDSHPTLSERLAALPRVAESNESLDSIPATSLISEITSIEEQLTKLLTDHIQNALAGAGGNN